MNISPLCAFFRAVIVTALVCCCLIGGIWGCMIAYENTLRISRGTDHPAVEWSDDGIRIFDYEF